MANEQINAGEQARGGAVSTPTYPHQNVRSATELACLAALNLEGDFLQRPQGLLLAGRPHHALQVGEWGSNQASKRLSQVLGALLRRANAVHLAQVLDGDGNVSHETCLCIENGL